MFERVMCTGPAVGGGLVSPLLSWSVVIGRTLETSIEDVTSSDRVLIVAADPVSSVLIASSVYVPGGYGVYGFLVRDNATDDFRPTDAVWSSLSLGLRRSMASAFVSSTRWTTIRVPSKVTFSMTDGSESDRKPRQPDSAPVVTAPISCNTRRREYELSVVTVLVRLACLCVSGQGAW